MVPIKTNQEIEIMKEGGAIAAQVKGKLIQAAQPGVTTAELDKLAEKLINEAGAMPSFKGYNATSASGGFPASIVTCINDEVVHGIPGPRQLKKGDLLTIDLGVFYHGFHTDTATTTLVGASNQQSTTCLPSACPLRLSRRAKAGSVANRQGRARHVTNQQLFLGVGQQSLERALNEVRPGNHIGDISHAIQQTIEKEGFNVIHAFTGHGVGKELHEPPQIPCFGKKGQGEEIKTGMTFAVEVMYVEGSPELKILDDDWTAVTKDGKLSAMFEETVVVTLDKPLILTC